MQTPKFINVKSKYLALGVNENKAWGLIGLIKGPALIIKSFRGNYRDDDEPL